MYSNLCANYFAKYATNLFHNMNAIGITCLILINLPSIPIRDCPLAFILRNKLVCKICKIISPKTVVKIVSFHLETMETGKEYFSDGSEQNLLAAVHTL